MKKKILCFSSLLLLICTMVTLIGVSSQAGYTGSGGGINVNEKGNRLDAITISGEVTIDVGEEKEFSFMPYVLPEEIEQMNYEVEDENVIYLTSNKYKFIGLKAGTSKLIISSAEYYTELTVVVAEKNFFSDGDMESIALGTKWLDNTSELDGWRLYIGSQNQVKDTQHVEVIEEDGNQVMRIKHEDLSYSNLYKQIPVIPGQYYVTARMKGVDVEKDAYVRVNQGNKNGLTQTSKVKGTFEWDTFTSDIVRVEANEKLKIELYFANNTGEVYFDDIKVYRVITKQANSFTVGNALEKLAVNEQTQIVCETFPASIIDYEYLYKVEDTSIVNVSKTGQITALKNGVTSVTVISKAFGYTKTVKVVVGEEDGIDASVDLSGLQMSTVAGVECITVAEDSKNTFTILSSTSSFIVEKYTDPSYGKYYIDGNKIVYTPNKNIYTLEGTYDSFKVIVFNIEEGFCEIQINVKVVDVDDACTVVDYWHTTPKNTALVWESATNASKINHTSGNIVNGGYIEVSCYDIEAIIPATKKANMTQAQREQKALMYQKIVGTSKAESFTITTANGGTVEILQNGVVQEIQDRYHSSTGKIIYGVLYNYTPVEGFTGYDTFEMVIANGDEKITVMNTVYVLPGVEDFKFDELDFSGVYLLSTEKWLGEVRTGLQNGDDYITRWVEYYEAQYTVFNPTGEPASARTPLEQLAILYQVTGKQKYFDLCWQQMREIVKDEAFSQDGTKRLSWGEDSNGFLDAAMVTYSVGFAYNFIKDNLTDEQKLIVIKALYEEGFYYFETLNNVNVLLHGNNHNLLVCGNLALAALSAMSYEGEIEVTVRNVTKTINVQEMAAETVMTAFKYLQIGLVHYSNSGGFPEGPSYSYYAHRNIVSLLATLYNLYGEKDGKIYSFGLSDIEGIMNYKNYPLYTSTPNYESFFYAESEYSNNQPALLWYTRINEDDINAAVLSKLADSNEQYNIMSLLWYTPGLFDKVNLQNMEQLDALLEEHELATFRESFGDEFALFTGLKGINGSSGSFAHKNLDSGTFEIYALGERFIGNYSNETYNTVVPDGFWDYDYQRWTYYKKSAQGQNTLVINPEKNPVLQQDPYEKAPITRFESNTSSGLSVIDLSGVYKKDALSVQRGLKIFNNRSNVLIQDEFELREESTIYWSAHTEARIDIVSDKLARLTLNGKSIYVLITSELGTFSKMSATALPGTTGLFCNLDNTGVNKLLIHLENVISGTLSVVFLPTLEEITEFTDYQVTPIASWTLDEDIDVNDAHVDEISMDTEFGDKYKYVFNPYQYKYLVRLDSNVKKVPELSVNYDKEKYRVTILTSKLFNELTKVVVEEIATGKKKTYEYKFIVDTIIEGYEEYTAINVLKAIGSAGVENLLDDDRTTTFTSDKKETVVLELADVTTITNILLRFSGGLLNTYYFDIYYSLDNVNYKACYFAGQSTNNMGDEVYSLGRIEAKYIKIVFNGNDRDDKVTVSKAILLNNNYTEEKSGSLLPVILGCVGGVVLLAGITLSIIIILKRRNKNEEKITSSTSND